MVLIGTYSRGGKGGVGAVSPVGGFSGDMDSGEDFAEEEEQVRREGAGAVVSAQAFDVSLLSEKEFDEQVGKFLDDHILVGAVWLCSGLH